MKPLYRFAQACVNADKLLKAALGFALSAAFIFGAVSLLWCCGLDWFTGVVAGLIAFIGACLLVAACGLVLETEPKNQTPLQRPFAFESTRDKKRRGREPDNS